MANHGACKSSVRDKDCRGQRAIRTCLKCGRPFISEHVGNRRCDACSIRLAGIHDWGSRHGMLGEVRVSP